MRNIIRRADLNQITVQVSLQRLVPYVYKGITNMERKDILNDL